MLKAPNTKTSFYNKGPLIINEVMANNKTTIYTSSGKHYDYIELYNNSNQDINLEGYFLSDNNSNTMKWKFPSVTIKANDYLIVYASGKDKFEDNEIHTNFKLDKKGENVILSDKDGKIISKIFFDELENDISYGYNKDINNYVYYLEGSPAKENTGAYDLSRLKKSPIKVRINEYLINNTILKSNDDKYYPVIELYNYGEEGIDLKGFKINDYTLDNFIEPQSFLLIYVSGKNTNIDTNFTIDNTDRFIFTDMEGRLLSEVPFIKDDKHVYGYYENEWHKYSEGSLGKENTNNYINEEVATKTVVINEVSLNPEAIELKNNTDKVISLKGYKLTVGTNKTLTLPDVKINPKSFIVMYGSDSYGYDGTIYMGFHLNNIKNNISLYNGELLIDTFTTTKLNANISCGRKDEKTVIFKNKTIGYENDTNYYDGFTTNVTYSENNIYVTSGTKITLQSNGDIYYTLDGSFPNQGSIKYTGPIVINNDTILKTIAYKPNSVESDITSRTYLVGRKINLPVVSVTANNWDLFGGNGLISNFEADLTKMVTFEYYDEKGSLGMNFQADATLSGMDSRLRDQKSIAIYLRKNYGTKDVTFPLFKTSGTKTYSSFTLRNAGEDPKGIRIMDTALTYLLNKEMDIDYQDYRSVVVYLNGEYYGLYNLRERLNGDYLKTRGIDTNKTDLIKYNEAKLGSRNRYDELYNFIKTHNVRDAATYEYIKKEIDVQELANYFIVESFYGNTDLGNIRYYKTEGGKWRWMLYDLDWSLWNISNNYGYPVQNTNIASATYLFSAVDINRALYQNPEYRDLYLKSFGNYLRTTFKPDRFNKVVDELAAEIDSEIPYHISRWHDISSYNSWKNNLERFKNTYNNRYNFVVSNLRGTFNLSNEEYNKYFYGL